jgi:hypothetical protein
MTSPLIYAAAYMLLTSPPMQHIPSTVIPIKINCDLSAPINCASGWDHDCRSLDQIAEQMNHVSIRWRGHYPHYPRVYPHYPRIHHYPYHRHHYR